MVNLMVQLTKPENGQYKTVIISGTVGSGRKTLALHMQKMYSQLTSYEVVELNELTIVEDHKIYICQDMVDIKTDNDILVIQMPSLSERKEDLIALAEFHIQVHALMNGKGKILISEKAKEKILAYTWPGEFPELERVMEQAVTASEKNVIEPEDLSLADAHRDLHFSLGLKLENVERQYILQTLFFAQQNRTKAAEILGISIRTLRNKLNQYRQEGYL
jgi:hypothetical protein